jgi:hypothetical protein
MEVGAIMKKIILVISTVLVCFSLGIGVVFFLNTQTSDRSSITDIDNAKKIILGKWEEVKVKKLDYGSIEFFEDGTFIAYDGEASGTYAFSSYNRMKFMFNRSGNYIWNIRFTNNNDSIEMTNNEGRKMFFNRVN